MNKLFAALAAATVSISAFAQQAEGEVTKVDKPQARITVKHNGIKHLDMPAMTMAFRVNDAKVLDTVAAGDRVRFSADKVNGSYTITSLSKAN
jgi:Cu(I)/Ag(I) efflux system periplasmic protein CusF